MEAMPDTDAVASAILRARAGGRRLDARQFATIGDAAGAYAIQRVVAGRAAGLLGPVAGYKIGMSTAAAQLQHGLDGPLMGRVYRRQLLASGATLELGPTVRIGLEVEVGIELGLDLAPSGGPVTAARAAAAVAAYHVAIELLEDRFNPAVEPSLWMRAADDMLGRGGVIGEELPAFDATLAHDGSLAVDGTDRARGSTADLAGGGPLLGLAWLANCLAEQGIVLRGGDVVFSGGLNPPLWLEPEPGGTTAIEARIDDGPCATLTISWAA
jgi:2-keto-4-pentenoate hydratase